MYRWKDGQFREAAMSQQKHFLNRKEKNFFLNEKETRKKIQKF
jgi:hypothetical protein